MVGGQPFCGSDKKFVLRPLLPPTPLTGSKVYLGRIQCAHMAGGLDVPAIVVFALNAQECWTHQMRDTGTAGYHTAVALALLLVLVAARCGGPFL